MRCSSRLLVAGLMVAGTHAAHAQIEVDTFHNPGDENDNFGEAVAQSGDVVVIGAGTGPNAEDVPVGAVYVYDVTDPGEVLRTLSPSDGRVLDLFGSAIDIEGEIVVVGAYGHSLDGLASSGAVYVYDITTGQEKKLVPEDPTAGEGFGQSVAISGNIVVVGVPNDDLSDIPTNDNEGSVYVFDLTTCNQIDKLRAPDATPGDRFGTSVAVAGGIIVVGTPGHGGSIGGAHTFDTNSLQFLNTIVSDSPQSFSAFGSTVALTETALLIGAPLASSDDETAAGVVTASDHAGATELHTFSSGAEGDEVGRSVATDSSPSRGAPSLAVIGAPGDDEAASGAGAAYVINADTGDIVTKLTAGDAQLFDLFGSAVSISGRYVVVGAPNEDTNGNNSGAAYLFLLDPPCPADLAEPFGVLDFSDVFAFLVAFGAMDPAADLAEPFGGFDFSDVFAFLTSFGGGCQ